MELQDLRKQINDIDASLLALFERRMQVSSDIASYKKTHDLPIYDPAREREVLCRISDLAGEGMDAYARMLFSTLFELSRAYQAGQNAQENALVQSIRRAMAQSPAALPRHAAVACQGVEGAYSQIACCKMFDAPNILYCKTFEGVFQAVQGGLCRFGILPIENSSYGSVTQVYDLMRDYRTYIVHALKLHVDHCLLAKPGTKLGDVREVFSHEQAIGQCAQYLSALEEKGVHVTMCKNTAEAAMRVSMSGRQDVASISSRSCAQLYGLSILKEHVQDCENNYTRFICIAKDLEIYPGDSKMSLMFTLPHTCGSLSRMISKFAALGLNVTKLESRPIAGRDFEFMFYADVEASVRSQEVLRLLGDLSATNECFSYLGSYCET